MNTPIDAQIYISSTRGNDKNNGTRQNPIKSIRELKEWARPGTKIFFERGGVWKTDTEVQNGKVIVSIPQTQVESGYSCFVINEALQSCKINSYGSGNLPVIDGSIQIQNSAITLDSGTVYKFTVIGCFQYDLFVFGDDVKEDKNHAFVTINGQRLERVADKATVAINKGTFFVESSGLEWTYYVNGFDSEDITGENIIVPIKSYIINDSSNRNNFELLENIKLTGPSGRDGSYLTGGKIKNVVFGETCINDSVNSDVINLDNNVEISNKYFNKRSTGQNLYNTLKSGHNVVMGCIGDSTTANGYPLGVLSQLAYKLGQLNEFKIVHYRFDNTTNESFYVDDSYGPDSDHISDVGIRFDGEANGGLELTDNSEWTSDDFQVEFKFSGYDIGGGEIANILTKWGTALSARSFMVRATGDNIDFEWMDGTLTQKGHYFTSALAGTTVETVNHFKITVDVDNGSTEHVLTLYTSNDDGKTWVIVGTPKVNSGVTTINKDTATEFNINTTNNNQTGAFSTSFKIHKATMQNGIEGEYICLPVNIEAWGTVPWYDSSTIEGTIPTLYIFNGSVGGKDYAFYDAAKLVQTTVRDVQQTYLINHGHNSNWAIGVEFRQEIIDFVTRLEAQVTRPNFIFSTQNPWKLGYSSESRKFTMPLKAIETRRYAIDNNCGYVDSMTAVKDLISGYKIMMNDSIHPKDLLYSKIADLFFLFFTGKNEII